MMEDDLMYVFLMVAKSDDAADVGPSSSRAAYYVMDVAMYAIH